MRRPLNKRPTQERRKTVIQFPVRVSSNFEGERDRERLSASFLTARADVSPHAHAHEFVFEDFFFRGDHNRSPNSFALNPRPWILSSLG